MFPNNIKCFVCNYEDEQKNWVAIEARSTDGYTSLSARKYVEEKGWDHMGSVSLYACPKCGTVRFTK